MRLGIVELIFSAERTSLPGKLNVKSRSIGNYFVAGPPDVVLFRSIQPEELVRLVCTMEFYFAENVTGSSSGEGITPSSTWSTIAAPSSVYGKSTSEFHSYRSHVLRIEAILRPLPLHARWVYEHQPEPGSEEAALVEVLLKPKDWV